MDQTDDKETEPKIPTTEEAKPALALVPPPVAPSPTEPAAAPTAEPAPPAIVFEGGDLALMPATIAKPDGTKARGHTLVRVVLANGPGYRVSLGRGLTTLVHQNHLTKPPADLDATLSVGDVIEDKAPDATPA